MRKSLKILGWLLLAAMLSAVSLAYTQPALMVQLSEQLWACF